MHRQYNLHVQLIRNNGWYDL